MKRIVMSMEILEAYINGNYIATKWHCMHYRPAYHEFGNRNDKDKL
jgi:hypothetical protein